MKISVFASTLLFSICSSLRDYSEDRLWAKLDPEWVESRILVTDAKRDSLLGYFTGKYGSTSEKKRLSGYLVPIPDIERSRKSLLGRGCASPGAYKLTKWRPKANRRRVRRGQWIALLYRGGCTFQEKIRLATKLGAAGAIIIDTTSSRSPSLMNTLGTSIVSASVSKVTGDRMRGLLTRGRPLHVSMSVGRMELAKENRPNVASNNTYSVFLSQHGFSIMKYNFKSSKNMASSSLNLSPASSCTFVVICLYSAVSSLFM